MILSIQNGKDNSIKILNVHFQAIKTPDMIKVHNLRNIPADTRF